MALQAARTRNSTPRLASPRARLEAAIEAGIRLLDQMDPDPDLEDDDDREAIDEREPEADGAETWGEGFVQRSIP